MYDKIAVEYFLKNQQQLFDENVADTMEEAAEFLDDLCAVIANKKSEVKDYMEEVADISGMSMDEILMQPEVFHLPDGRYLIVEG